MSGENEPSSMEVLEYDVEGTIVRSSRNGRAIVDEVNSSPDGIAVYVKGSGAEHNDPPRKLTKLMLEHGYAYISWAMNGRTDDGRAIFEFKSINEV